MTKTIILDTGVLIAFLMPKDKFHRWAVSQFEQITAPVIKPTSKFSIEVNQETGLRR